MSDVVLPARLMKLMGAEVLFLTNAAGGIQLGMNAGDFMLTRIRLQALFLPRCAERMWTSLACVSRI